MNDKFIEARLERSLRNQITAPRLQKRFDAAVWARIDAETKRVPAKPAPSSNWLFVMNGIGIGVAVVLFAVFGLQSLSGIEANVSLPAVSMPAPATIDLVTKYAAQALTVVALGFGLMFTPLGRRARQELRAFL